MIEQKKKMLEDVLGWELPAEQKLEIITLLTGFFQQEKNAWSEEAERLKRREAKRKYRERKKKGESKWLKEEETEEAREKRPRKRRQKYAERHRCASGFSAIGKTPAVF